MRNKLNVKQKATREPDERRRLRKKHQTRFTESVREKEKEREKKCTFYEKYETEINRKRTKCKRKLFFFGSHKNEIDCKPSTEREREKKTEIMKRTMAKAY